MKITCPKVNKLCVEDGGTAMPVVPGGNGNSSVEIRELVLSEGVFGILRHSELQNLTVGHLELNSEGPEDEV